MEEFRMIKPKKKEALERQYIGVVFGKLTITEIIGIKKKRTIVKAVCECGKTKEFLLYNILRKHTKSCGCNSSVGLSPLKHGEAKRGAVTIEYLSFLRMKTNALSKSEKVRRKYKKIDALGISICDRWLDKNVGYQNFLEDMGRKPSKNHTLVRINNKEGFYKDNCDWRLKNPKTVDFQKEKFSIAVKEITEAWESGSTSKFKNAIYGNGDGK